jgi:hypothetical protein
MRRAGGEDESEGRCRRRKLLRDFQEMGDEKRTQEWRLDPFSSQKTHWKFTLGQISSNKSRNERKTCGRSNTQGPPFFYS